jgi:hypothetical protein
MAAQTMVTSSAITTRIESMSANVAASAIVV